MNPCRVSALSRVELGVIALGQGEVIVSSATPDEVVRQADNYDDSPRETRAHNSLAILDLYPRRSDEDRVEPTKIHQPYDPAPETVAVLRQHTDQRMAAFDFFAVDVQPYFTHNPFFNQPHSYWVWTTTANSNGAFFTTIEQHPSLVLFSADLLSPGFTHNDWAPLSETSEGTHQRDLSRNPILRALKADHYIETHRFCGHRFMRASYSYETCHLIFEEDDKVPK